MILEDSQWFAPNFGEAGYYFRDIFENYKPYKEKAVRQAYQSKTKFSFDCMKSSSIISLTAALLCTFFNSPLIKVT